MSFPINNNSSTGLQALAKVLQFSRPAAPSIENTEVQRPNWQTIQSQSTFSQNSSEKSNASLNVTYSYATMIKTDLSLVGSSVISPAAPSAGTDPVSSLSSGYDLSVSDSNTI